jgi:calcineurin-like phosphoesterase family protein
VSNVFYTSDLHFSHRRVSEIRGFDDPSAHDAALILNWNSVVQPCDTVFVLGDVSLMKPARYMHLTNMLNGTKHLIFGNHDPGNGGNRDAHKYGSDYWNAGFVSSHDFLRRRIGGRNILLSHYPYSGDHTEEDRMAQYRLPDLGLPLLHGHVHSGERLTFSKTGTAQIHVGLDAWDLTPVNQAVIEKILSS